MNSFRIAKVFLVFSSLLYLTITFLQNYNSSENIEKRCLFKFDKDFKNSSTISQEEWEMFLDLADNNYLKCMNIPNF